jgi:hypothetical protein
VGGVQTGHRDPDPGRLVRLPWSSASPPPSTFSRPAWAGPCSGPPVAAAAGQEPVRPNLGWRLAFGLGAILGRASAAYLTGSEIFPMEARAMALASFYADGTGIGGVTGPALFGKLVETGKEVNVFYGYLIGAALMIAAGVTEWLIGVEAAGKSLEDVAKPLTAHDEEAEAMA